MSDDSAELTRREFLGMTASAVFLYGFDVPLSHASEAPKTAPFAPNAFIRIDGQGVVTLIIPQVRWGRAPTRRCR